jgi:hypothetical protein
MAKFELPRDCNTGLVRTRTLSNLGLSFRDFKGRMWSQYGQMDKMPDWDKYPVEAILDWIQKVQAVRRSNQDMSRK